jgi:hypothetical protein
MRHYVLLFLLFLLSFALVYFLYRSTNYYDKKFDFNRVYNKAAVHDFTVVKLEDSITGFAGIGDRYLYFFTAHLGVLVRYDFSFKNSAILSASLRTGWDSKVGNQFYAVVNYPVVYFCAYGIGTVFQCNVLDLSFSILREDSFGYSKFVAIDSNSFVFRRFNTKENDQSFLYWNTKFDLSYDNHFSFPVHHDGGISTDGKLIYDKSQKKIVYVLIYQGYFFVFDSSMNTIQSFKTVDAIGNVSIQVSDKNGIYTSSSPSKRINSMAAVYNGKIYINSFLMSKVDNPKSFSDSSVIDVYDESLGIYQYSFYLPRVDKKKIESLYIVDGYLACYYPHAVVFCRLSH